MTEGQKDGVLFVGRPVNCGCVENCISLTTAGGITENSIACPHFKFGKNSEKVETPVKLTTNEEQETMVCNGTEMNGLTCGYDKGNIIKPQSL